MSCQNCSCNPNTTRVYIGSKAPDFEVRGLHSDEVKTFRLTDYRSKWTILFFYPGDFTFVCPTELEELANCYNTFKELNCEILSVSTDSEYVHKAWKDTSEAVKKVSFPMLSDSTHEVSKLYGVYLEKEGVALRGTFLIDPDGVLSATEVHDNSIGRSAKELLRKLQAAQFVAKHGGNVCPASWQPGDDTLLPGLDLVGKI
jgi:NADH-dependent peroxiredoxin subunit C